MAGGPYYPRQPGSLKQATRELVTLLGGQLEAARLSARVSDSRVGDYASETGNHLTTSYVPVDIVERWERAARAPIVTRWLAHAQGHALIALSRASGHESYAGYLAKIGREAGEVVGSIADAMANGAVDAKERAEIRRELAELMTQCSAMMASLDAEARRD
jgi:hypothetical protein